MPVLIQVDFTKEAPFGDEMAAKFKESAESISKETGLIWKIWCENENDNEAGGIYVFEDHASADAYLQMHVSRLEAQGFQNIRAKTFDINEPLTQITRGPITSNGTC